MAIGITSAIGLGLTAATSVAGGIASMIQSQRAKAELDRRRAQAESTFSHAQGTNYLDTAAAKSAIAQMRRDGDRRLSALDTATVRAGVSDEGRVAAAGRIGDSQADAISRLAGMGTQYEQQLKDRHLQRLDGLDNAIYNANMSRASATAGIIDSVGNAVGSGLMAYGAGAFEGRKRRKTTPALVNNIPSPMAGNVDIEDYITTPINVRRNG